MTNLKKVFDYLQTTPWTDDTPDETVFEAAKRAFRNIIGEREFTKSKKYYRIAGQSGTGKTTQLLPVVLEFEKRKGNTPVVIAVREFAEYHPNYKMLLSNFGKANVREMTNGFSLKCLCATFKMFVENGYLIVLDITMFHPTFEKYLLTLLQVNKYTTEYHVMAVNRKISDKLVNKRIADGADGGRKVSKDSIDYFMYILCIGLDYLAAADADAICFVWTVFDKDPLYYGNFSKIGNAVKQGQSKIQSFAFHEDELREAKLNYLLAR